jgi:probable phosphoglycerate mutase
LATFLLIRHAAHALGGDRIAGRTPGVPLSPDGRRQAAELSERLAALPVQALYCSPIQRARETAAPLAARWRLPVQVREEISELDFGEWSGQPLDELRPQERWQRFNRFRSGTRAPGGELMLETQARIVTFMQALRDEHPDQFVALVSHGDVIKSAVAYYLGVPLDLFQRLEIGLASVSVVHIGDYGPWVLCVNETGRVSLPY